MSEELKVPLNYLRHSDVVHIMKLTPEQAEKVDEGLLKEMARILVSDYAGQLYWTSLRTVARRCLKGAGILNNDKAKPDKGVN